MSADNWTECPACIERGEKIKKAFVEKYYGKLDSHIYSMMIKEVDEAFDNLDSGSSSEYEPDEKILKIMEEKEICVEINNESYDASMILWCNKVSCCMREDYEHDPDYVSYSCSCCNCGFGRSVILKNINSDINFDATRHKIVGK